MSEGTVIHMVRDPVTLQNEEIISSMAVESNIYVTERRNTLQYIIQDSKFITHFQFLRSKNSFLIRFKVPMVKYLEMGTFLIACIALKLKLFI